MFTNIQPRKKYNIQDGVQNGRLILKKSNLPMMYMYSQIAKNLMLITNNNICIIIIKEPKYYNRSHNDAILFGVKILIITQIGLQSSMSIMRKICGFSFFLNKNNCCDSIST